MLVTSSHQDHVKTKTIISPVTTMPMATKLGRMVVWSRGNVVLRGLRGKEKSLYRSYHSLYSD